MAIRKLLLSTGAMKAGTTFLYHALSRHPGIAMCPEKELHFFAHADGLAAELMADGASVAAPAGLLGALGLARNVSRRGDRSAPGRILAPAYRRSRLAAVMRNRYARVKDPDELRRIVLWYAERFLADPVDDAWYERVHADAGERWAADFSNYTALLPDAGWVRVRRLAGEVRVVYTVREPVERLWSHIRFFLAQSGRRSELERLDPAALAALASQPDIAAHGRYNRIISNLRRHLAPEELMVLKLERLVADLPQELARIERFLDLPPGRYAGVDPSRKANEGEARALPEAWRQILADSITREDYAIWADG